MTSSVGSALVFGGRGFVGGAICRELARRGIPVMSLSRSSQPGSGGNLGTGVEQHSGVDALKPETYKAFMNGARAVVIAIGEAPWSERTGGSRERAVQMNGHTNIAVLRAAAEASVQKIALVNATMPSWALIEGYREGKELAEKEAQMYPETSGLGADGCGVLVMKPGVVTGTKYWGSVPLPFGAVMEPQRLAMRCLSRPCAAIELRMPKLLGGILRPAVRVQELASAAADSIQEDKHSGVVTLEPKDLVGYAA